MIGVYGLLIVNGVGYHDDAILKLADAPSLDGALMGCEESFVVVSCGHGQETFYPDELAELHAELKRMALLKAMQQG